MMNNIRVLPIALALSLAANAYLGLTREPVPKNARPEVSLRNASDMGSLPNIGRTLRCDSSIGQAPPLDPVVATPAVMSQPHSQPPQPTPQSDPGEFAEVFEASRIRSLYGPMFVQLRLDAETQDRLSHLLTARLEGRSPETELVNLLGDKYDVYREYDSNLPQHVEVTRLQTDLAAARVNTLTPESERKLLEVMIEEKNLYTQAVGTKPDEAVDMGQWRDDYDQRVLSRAESILSAAQMETLRYQFDSRRRERNAMASAIR